MALAAFQQAICELIASPDLCQEVRSEPSAFLGRHNLSERERQRLLELVWQRGMSTNCTLYRSNRVTPIYTLLHFTCIVLGDRLKPVLEEHWAEAELIDLEFGPEIDRFYRFLKRRLAKEAITDRLLEEVLEFEFAANQLRFAPRRQVLRQFRRDSGPEGALGLHPLVRVVRFWHDPNRVMEAFAQKQVPRGLPERERFVVLRA